MKNRSLRLRLMAGILLLSILCWGAAAFGSWWQTRHSINELFDTQQMLFAKRLAAINPERLSTEPLTLPKTKKLLRHHRGDQEEDALAFAIFSRDGKMLINDGDKGKKFQFNYRQDGFTDGTRKDDDDSWRLVWLTTSDGRAIVVVGQEWEYRDDMTRDLVQTNLTPWLLALPVMMLLMLWLVTRELSPLKNITQQLRLRAADETAPLKEARVPQEVRPMLDELNLLFARTGTMLLRERRFTSDAAHELRSPLAALKVQTEVAQLVHDDAPALERALKNLDTGIDRATRLVDQLLTLSRLDNGKDLQKQSLDLRSLLQQAVIDHYEKARSGGIDIVLEAPEHPEMIVANPLLLALLVRNLLDNAIRYSSAGGKVILTLTGTHLTVSDSGPGIPEEILPRIGERFYRPPGQEQSGSGLGLSIVHHIARLHGMRVRLVNLKEGGLSVVVER